MVLEFVLDCFGHILPVIFPFCWCSDKVRLLYIRLWEKSKSCINLKWNSSLKWLSMHVALFRSYVIDYFPISWVFTGAQLLCIRLQQEREGYVNRKWHHALKCLSMHVSLVSTYITGYFAFHWWLTGLAYYMLGYGRRVKVV